MKDRMSTVAREGYIKFISNCREASGTKDLHPHHLRTDDGSEFKGEFTTWNSAQAAVHADMYAHSINTSGNASVNSLGERHIAT